MTIPIACSGPKTGDPSTAAETSISPTVSASFIVDDVRIVRVPDDVAVHWDLTFDAEWTGTAVPAPVRCRWRIENREGDVVQVGIVNIADASVDDKLAGTVYPDEIPGVPETAEVRC